MKNDGLSDYTIRFTDKALTYLSKHADLGNPETVKRFIANTEHSDGYKRNLALSYNRYCRYYNIEWKMPLYRQEATPIRIPTKEKLDMIIASSRKTLATKLTLSMETGLRPVELCNLKVEDVDLEQRMVYPTTAKRGRPRTFKISNNLTKLLQAHIIRNDLSPTDKLFKGDADNYGKKYRDHRNRLAKKLQDPTIHQIRLYDFRHYYATTLYHKTKDILYVKQQMGHKKLETTLIYTQLLNLNDDEWTCRTATTVKQATQLIEAGFEYVTEMHGMFLFRKRK